MAGQLREGNIPNVSASDSIGCYNFEVKKRGLSPCSQCMFQVQVGFVEKSAQEFSDLLINLIKREMIQNEVIKTLRISRIDWCCVSVVNCQLTS